MYPVKGFSQKPSKRSRREHQQTRMRRGKRSCGRQHPACGRMTRGHADSTRSDREPRTPVSRETNSTVQYINHAYRTVCVDCVNNCIRYTSTDIQCTVLYSTARGATSTAVCTQRSSPSCCPSRLASWRSDGESANVCLSTPVFGCDLRKDPSWARGSFSSSDSIFDHTATKLVILAFPFSKCR